MTAQMELKAMKFGDKVQPFEFTLEWAVNDKPGIGNRSA